MECTLSQNLISILLFIMKEKKDKSTYIDKFYNRI